MDLLDITHFNTPDNNDPHNHEGEVNCLFGQKPKAPRRTLHSERIAMKQV